MEFLKESTRYLFFTGKGGVGKTSLSCATAVSLASRGKRILLISTDPASNLEDVLQTAVTTFPTPIPGLPNLEVVNVDPEKAAADYREKTVSVYRGVLPEATIRSMEEQLSGACTTEIAAFDLFTDYIVDEKANGRYDHVIFDTAPTGHTLRLLELPAAWSDYLSKNTTGATCMGPLSGLAIRQAGYSLARTRLCDPDLTTLVLVTRPERSALIEADRSSCELATIGIENQQLVVNGMLEVDGNYDPVAAAIHKHQQLALTNLSDRLRAMPVDVIPLVSYELMGIPALGWFFDGSSYEPGVSLTFPATTGGVAPVEDLVAKLSQRSHNVVMTMGKGGVGKSTVASQIAKKLSGQGHRVLFVSTDPAGGAAGEMLTGVPNLTFEQIDPKKEVEDYVREVKETVGSNLDDEGRKLLDEELRSPCTEEIAVFRKFADLVQHGTDGFVVVDTAPTGHTLLLLDASLAYQRQVDRNEHGVPESVKLLLSRIRDPLFTAVLLVSLAEATPVYEAAALQSDLLRAGIKPYGWVINRSITNMDVRHPVLAARQNTEHLYIEKIRELSPETWLMPWSQEFV